MCYHCIIHYKVTSMMKRLVNNWANLIFFLIFQISGWISCRWSFHHALWKLFILFKGGVSRLVQEAMPALLLLISLVAITSWSNSLIYTVHQWKYLQPDMISLILKNRAMMIYVKISLLIIERKELFMMVKLAYSCTAMVSIYCHHNML